MKLEERLAKWAEHSDDDMADDDYGLIIDDSVMAEPPQPLPPQPPQPPRFNKAGSCSLIPSSTVMSPSALLPANIHALGRQWARTPGGNGNIDILQKYVEAPDSENYDDLVLPEDEGVLDRQLAEWRTPRRKSPEWSRPTTDAPQYNELTMSGATAVDVPTSAPGLRKTAGLSPDDPPEDWVFVAAGAGKVEARKHTPRAAAMALGLGLGLVQPVRAVLSNGSKQRVASRSRLADWQHVEIPPPANPATPPAQQPQQQQQQQSRPSPRPTQSPPQLQQLQLQRQRQQHVHQAQRCSRRPILIKNTPRANEPMVLGAMRYDPISRLWTGNEEECARFAQALAESERQLRARTGSMRGDRLIDTEKLARKLSQRTGGSSSPSWVPTMPERTPGDAPEGQEPVWRRSPPLGMLHNNGRRPASPLSPGALDPSGRGRPALILPSAAAIVGQTAAAAGACGRAKPIFDPQNLRWIDPNESQRDPASDPFWNITELPLEPKPPSAAVFRGRPRSSTEALGSPDPGLGCFVLTEEQIEAYQRESAEYESFARHWFPKKSSA
ncbi:hypothetical protein GGI07_000656 [Coemansia sp. Benny D115]|nr:hypothetical protein GGI07_000656 [Coemansia sp. Benny D115]